MTLIDESRADSAERVIRRKIIELELPPGSLVSANDLTGVTGTGVMPVRVALARLHQEGLVEPEPKAGWRVSPMTPREFDESFDVRLVLEAEAAALAARAARGDPAISRRLRELDRRCQASYNARTPSTITAFLQRNTEFHVGIALLGNRRLAVFLRQLLETQERYFHWLLRTKRLGDLIAHEHKQLLATIDAGDVAGAKREVLAQGRAIRKRTVEALQASLFDHALMPEMGRR